ncbi:DUF302 domain-containing protein [Pseudomonas auratipiscis]|uniref:DUF302 domain-containing protein n=2 Tax=Pseudomonas TaxID=286 RepID=A0AB35WL86_9PSED|nr:MULTISPECIES: DUF302 domain-containing protein [unclassified Pseudomonas]MEE1864953.1 DUF302 domain-containing protein [Pseudomonas sp. 120P]MEE1956106.1 DUF302 domain-containing protein [Pseudomonas sp. 119P]
MSRSPSFYQRLAMMPATTLLGLLLLFAFAGAATATATQESHTVNLSSPYSFDETLNRVRSMLTDNGLTIFAQIDHQGAARKVDLQMPPTTVLIYGNPKAGTPFMLAAPNFALELPLRVLIRADENGRTWVVYEPAASLDGRHGLPEGMAERLGAAEKLLAAAIQAPTQP